MHYPKVLCSISVLAFFLILKSGVGQSTLNVDSLIQANATAFKGGTQFSGPGWEQLLEKAKATNYVLIGEDHFLNEVPLFTRALAGNLDIDNYICEIDPWMLNVFEDKITGLSKEKLQRWISENKSGFSFFQKEKEFELLVDLVNQKINLIGTEQVGLMSTTILFQYLVDTGSPANKARYTILRDSSAAINNIFFNDFSNPFFLSTDFFAQSVAKLDRTQMNTDEANLIDAMIKSAFIYKTGSHKNRIKLMQGNLLSNYPHPLKGKKNLFKFGANHSMKGESYLPVYDIGTTAHILAQAENQDSYHILILPRAGNQAGFLNGEHPVDLSEEPYQSLKMFFDQASTTDWTYVNLELIRSVVRKKNYRVESQFLEKTLKGYDGLVIIPFSTAASALR